MSGGSYNYLCYKSADELTQSIEDLESMRDRLKELCFSDLANETDAIIKKIQLFKFDMTLIIDKISPVWRSIEWYDSGDTDLEDVKESVVSYRKK